MLLFYNKSIYSSIWETANNLYSAQSVLQKMLSLNSALSVKAIAVENVGTIQS